MKLLTLLLLLFTLALNIVVVSLNFTRTLQIEWNQFKLQHQKLYRSLNQETRRFQIFQRNFAKIQLHNQFFVRGLTTYTMGITEFSDMTDTEFLKYLQNGIKFKFDYKTRPFIIRKRRSLTVCKDIDWCEKGVVSPVRNQGPCGSCWSFSAIGALESQYAIKHKKKITLSEQNLIDCSSEFGNAGCNGGFMVFAFKYMKNFGIMLEDDYPYEGISRNCRYNKGKSVVNVTGYVEVEENSVAEALERYGPLSAAVHVTPNLRFYTGGIFNDRTCNKDAINHAVLLVGVKMDNYWKLKNSWGERWGEAGFFRINYNNDCGVTSKVSFPIIK